MDTRDEVLASHSFFAHKHLIMKPWTPEVDFEKEDLKTILTWIQLKLHLKYWGEKTLNKIVSQL